MIASFARVPRAIHRLFATRDARIRFSLVASRSIRSGKEEAREYRDEYEIGRIA